MHWLLSQRPGKTGRVSRVALIPVMVPALLLAPLGTARILLHDHHGHGFHGHVTKGSTDSGEGVPAVPSPERHDHDNDGLADQTPEEETVILVMVPDLTVVAAVTSIVFKVTVPSCGFHNTALTSANSAALQPLSCLPRGSPSIDISKASSGASDVLQRNHALLL